MYYYYRLSKSSIWGHSLRKMQPSTQYNRINSLLNELDIEISEERFHLSLGHSLKDTSVNDDFDKVYSEITHILGIKEIIINPFQKLDKNQFQIVLDYLFSIENELKKMFIYINVENVIKINCWKINNKKVKTMSELGINYGCEPYIGTEFILNNEEEFYYLYEVFNRNNICKLNKKHLSPIKNPKFSL